jgi:hypothetical protein
MYAWEQITDEWSARLWCLSGREAGDARLGLLGQGGRGGKKSRGAISRGNGKPTYSVGEVNEGVVHGNDGDIVVLDGIAEDDTANAAESVDANLDDHFVC